MRVISGWMLAVLAMVMMVFGCASMMEDGETASVEGYATNDFAAVETGPVRRAICIGLTAVDPNAYDGWDGACPGCDVDEQVFALLCREQGLQVAELRNSAATKDALLDISRKAFADMKAGDLMVLFISGHGGQFTDLDGDEDDGMDETLCLWDGQLTDDVLRMMWEEVPLGVRVLFVSDTCNSGTNFKYKPRSLRKAVPKAYAGQLIHFGGCADGLSSYGNASGGRWTTALVDGWNATNTYKHWFDASAATMPKNQTPYYAEYGAVDEAFRNGPALQ